MMDIDSDIEKLSKGRVLCIGDIMLDRYVRGDVLRISPEAPIPILLEDNSLEMLGGMGNVLNNLVNLNCHVSSINVIGRDDASNKIKSLLQGLDLANSIFVEEDRQSTVKTRFCSGNNQILRVDSETVAGITRDSAEFIEKKFLEYLDFTDVVILSDYGKGVFSSDFLSTLIGLSVSQGVKVVVDPKGRDLGRYRGADFITPNRSELEASSGIDCSEIAGVLRACEHIRREHDIGSVLATLSDEGMLFVDREGYKHYQEEVREVYDVAGAGDTVVAIFAAGIGGGISSDRAAKIANMGGSVVVSKAGTASVEIREIRKAQQLSGGYGLCLIGEEQVHNRLLDWKRRGLSVGFANGCFDVLHVGHIRMIKAARESCDRLIVAVNSDDSVKNLKGDSRPINTLERRIEMLSSISGVDGIISFNEDTPLKTIMKFRPDIIFKGGDYREHEVVGYEESGEWGGRVQIFPLYEGLSTSGILDSL